METLLLYPVFVQVALMAVLHVMMGRARIGSLKSGEVKVKDIALRQPNWTARTTQIGNSYHSQLELPVVFFTLIAFVMITHSASTLMLVLAWVFVLARIVHAYIHTTSNDIKKRFPAYVFGGAVLLVMWIVFAAGIVLGT
jgi:hypothetical protein